jgi:hypothetical protein
VDIATRAWMLAELGTTTDIADLDSRYTRLGSARAVALEVLRERLQTLLSQPLKVTVSGVITVDNSANVAALERQIAQLGSGEDPAPDDPAVQPAATGPDLLILCARPRR